MFYSILLLFTERQFMKMHLLYIWNDGDDMVEHNTGYQLNSKYIVKYDNTSPDKIEIQENPLYISEFWGDNILDIMAVVGENGSGKTQLMNYIIKILSYIENPPSNIEDDFFIILSDTSDCYICYATHKYAELLKASANKNFEIIDLSNKNTFKKLTNYNIGYFTNALSLRDYQFIKDGNVYDASAGALIRQNFQFKKDMKYISGGSELRNYFLSEDEKILNFRFSEGYKKCVEAGGPDLNYVHITVISYKQNESALIELFPKESSLKEPSLKESLLKMTNAIQKEYAATCSFVVNVILNIMLNIIRSLCVEQTSGENKEKERSGVSRVLCEVRQNLNTKKDIFDVGHYFLKMLKEKINFNNNYPVQIEDAVKFIEWIKTKHNSEQMKNTAWNSLYCKLDEANKNFINEFFILYKATSFPFLYLEFSFNISSGEFYFLNLYTNLYGDEHQQLLKINDNYSQKNILLIFDEADMLLHPRWQQQYVKNLTNFITSIADKRVSIHILIATHSPILLSDFPRENVLYLRNKKVINKSNKTFGCNIHKMFLDSFFLDENGMIGEFAYNKINFLANKISDPNVEPDKNDLKIIEYIGDNIIKNQLLRILKRPKPFIENIFDTSENNDIEKAITLLKKKQAQTATIIEELENLKKYDKNNTD